ncbi:MAG TPA: hypothetical protein VES97_05355 [Solirubrobacteraceae bacterium]|nr:hypothetical protein [Solirubrobacteraceae bacterium]HYM67642.1 hypothetical protein [Patescibacteria group bacterium]
MALTPIRTGSHHRGASRRFPSHSYLTDGSRLFRVVSRPRAEAGHMSVALEDCLTLEVRSYSPRKLDLMDLRPVGAAAGD